MTILTTLRDHTGADLTAETELSDVLDELDRVYSLAHWLEECGHRLPTDAELMSFRFVGDVLRWAGEEITA